MWFVTPAGRAAWESEDLSVPADFRRLLWLLDVQGDTRAIQALLREQPEARLREWLAELEELRLVESRERSPDVDRTIPLELDAPALEAGAQAATRLSSSGAFLALHRVRERRNPRPAAEQTVLIVEDDPDQLALADLRVSMAGYQVRVAASIDRLLRSLEKDGPPDLLLLDVMLPDGNGFDVLAKLRRHPRFSALPIVLLTVEASPANIGKGLALGADGYIVKPYSKSNLEKVLSSVLG